MVWVSAKQILWSQNSVARSSEQDQWLQGPTIWVKSTSVPVTMCFLRGPDQITTLQTPTSTITLLSTMWTMGKQRNCLFVCSKVDIIFSSCSNIMLGTCSLHRNIGGLHKWLLLDSEYVLASIPWANPKWRWHKAAHFLLPVGTNNTDGPGTEHWYHYH